MFYRSPNLSEPVTYHQSHLLAQVAEGRSDAFRALYDRYKHELYAFALGISRSIPTAEEIVQDTFIKVWLHRAELPGIEKFDGWLFTIARNHCYTALRKAALDHKAKLAHLQNSGQQELSAEELIITKENRALVQAAIRRLPEQQRRVYLLSREAGMTYDEIATELAVSRNTVKEHLRRATTAIKNYLDTTSGIEPAILLILQLF